MKNEQLDFVAIGDMVTDAFIELEDAWVEVDNPKASKELCMRFGDKIPYRDAVVIPAVGNSPNASVSAHRLGLKSAIISNLGKDKNGAECLEALQKEGVNSNFVKEHDGLPSNYHYVLRFKAERTILVKHTQFPYEFPHQALAEAKPKWLYLSSLADNSLDYHFEIIKFLENNPDTKLAFQPGTFQMKLGAEKLASIYKKSEIFFCNKEEAQKITGSDSDDIKILLQAVSALGPKITIITDGPNGSYAFDNAKYYKCPMYPDPKPPVERTGAGDSYASTVTTALILGMLLKDALRYGPVNSASVVQHIGAQKGLLTLPELENWLSQAPADYVVEEF